MNPKTINSMGDKKIKVMSKKKNMTCPKEDQQKKKENRKGNKTAVE